MKFARYIYGLLAFALGWVACSKDDVPPDVVEDPVFMVAYQSSGGDTASITAGIDSVYLFTDHRSDNQQIVCSGAFADASCPEADCPGSLTFEFSTPFTDTFSPESVFHIGGFNFINLDSGGTSIIYRGTFQVDNTSGFDSFLWRIDDADAGDGPVLVYDFPNLSVTPLIELSAQRPSGLRSVISRNVSPIGNTPTSVSLKIDQDSTLIIYKITAEITPPGFDSLLLNGIPLQDTVLYSDDLSDFYSVAVLQGTGFATASLEGLNVDQPPARTPNFNLTVNEIIVPGPPGEVAIQWVDPSGGIWRSDRNNQDSFAFFVVEESEDYDNNEKGQKTRKMRVSFYCRLFNTTGESGVFSGSGVIAVAYPE